MEHHWASYSLCHAFRFSLKGQLPGCTMQTGTSPGTAVVGSDYMKANLQVSRNEVLMKMAKSLLPHFSVETDELWYQGC